MKCMCAQTRPRFILSSKGVFRGMEFEPMLTPREKSPLPENVPRGGSNPRHCGQRTQALPTELFQPLGRLYIPILQLVVWLDQGQQGTMLHLPPTRWTPYHWVFMVVNSVMSYTTPCHTRTHHVALRSDMCVACGALFRHILKEERVAVKKNFLHLDF